MTPEVPCRFLVVDPDQARAEQIRRLVDSRGDLVVARVQTGAAAYERATALSIDAALVQIHTDRPGGGIDMAARLRDLKVPSVLVLDLADIELLDRARAASPVGFLAWPVRPDVAAVMLESIRSACRIARHRSGPDSAGAVSGPADAVVVQAQKLELTARLARGAVHDFNNVLAAFMGYAALIHKQQDADANVRRWASMMLSAAERARAITRRLLTFGRVEGSERGEDLAAHLSRSRPLLEGLLGETIGLELRQQRTGVGVPLTGEQLDQILLNLLANARDAMPQGGMVRVQTLGTADNPSRVRLEVSDTGLGMDVDTLRRSTEVFFTTKPDTGTGLGLYAVKRLVEGVGGTLQLHSTERVGTTVLIDLPIVPLRSAEERADSRHVAGPLRALEVVVAEPDDGVRNALRALLERDGHRVHPAGSAPEALFVLDQQETVDLLIAEVHMRYLDGVQLAERVRRTRPGIAVLLTASTAAASIDETVARDPRMLLLRKPFAARELFSAIDQLAPAGADAISSDPREA